MRSTLLVPALPSPLADVWSDVLVQDFRLDAGMKEACEEDLKSLCQASVATMEEDQGEVQLVVGVGDPDAIASTCCCSM